MKSWLTMALALGLLAGCRPSDQKIKSVKERVLAGEFVQFTEPGYSLCGTGRAWDNMDFGDNKERDRVIFGSQRAFFNPGWSACYRVGDVISTGIFKRGPMGGGKVRINSVGLVLLDEMYGKNAAKLEGKFFASADNLNSYKAGLTNRMKDKDLGIISVIGITYVPGTAVDEAEVRERVSEAETGDGFQETVNDGDSVSSCKKEWTDFKIAPEVQDAVMKGELRSWFQLGRQQCLKQGQIVDLKAGFSKDSPVVAKIKVKKVRTFRVKYMKREWFDSPVYKYEDIQQAVQKANETRKDDSMSVVDFEIQGVL